MIDIIKFSNDMLENYENIYIHGETVYATNGSIMVVCNKRFISDDIQKLLKPNPPEALRNLYLDLPFMDFKSISINDIEDTLKGITPDKFPVYGEVRCPECKGAGIVDCECLECGNEHKTECKRCEGEEKINGKQIGVEIQYTPVTFGNALIDYKYLSLILDVMKSEAGEWQVRLEPFKPCIFKTQGITIIVMPCRPEGL